MKLFVLTSRFPYPLEKGDKLRLYHQLRFLAGRHDIYLCAIADAPVLPADLDALRPLCKEIYILEKASFPAFRALFGLFFKGQSLQVSYFFSRKNQRRVREIYDAVQPDLTYCQLVRCSEYARKLPGPKLLDYMDALSLGMKRRARQSRWPERWVWDMEGRTLARYEKQVARHFDNFTVISHQDRRYLEAFAPAKIQVLPNGVDTSYFQHDGLAQPTHDVCFVGNLGYAPNVNAAHYLIEKVMPLVWAQRPQTTVMLAGARPTVPIRAMASERVTVTGWIPDIRKGYMGGKIFAAPLFMGSGLQNKMLEAMAMRLPCITTSLVNRSIEAQPNESILIADDAQAFADAILYLLEHEALRRKIADSAAAWVASNYRWQQFVEQLDQLMQDTVDVYAQRQRAI